MAGPVYSDDLLILVARSYYGQLRRPASPRSRFSACLVDTMGSAYASFEENLKGWIEPGKLEDAVVLSDDIFGIDPVRIADTKVAMTIFDGRVIEGGK
ncbi:MAG: amidohydrolase family protein [Acidobacteriaceae bacterium]|nr:amidohydrolase family protein [Acidobacteriaceae bacterium]